jgi:hypothetical protein
LKWVKSTSPAVSREKRESKVQNRPSQGFIVQTVPMDKTGVTFQIPLLHAH